MKEIKIEKILVVDDKQENLHAAKEALSLDFDVVCVDNVEGAKEAIVDAYENDKFDIVLSDMQMTTSKSGLKVVEASYTYQTVAFIVTEGKGHHGHSNQVLIKPDIGVVYGNKSQPKVWQEIKNKVIEALTEGSWKENCLALDRYYRYVGEPNKENANLILMLFR